MLVLQILSGSTMSVRGSNEFRRDIGGKGKRGKRQGEGTSKHAGHGRSFYKSRLEWLATMPNLSLEGIHGKSPKR